MGVGVGEAGQDSCSEGAPSLSFSGGNVLLHSSTTLLRISFIRYTLPLAIMGTLRQAFYSVFSTLPSAQGSGYSFFTILH